MISAIRIVLENIRSQVIHQSDRITISCMVRDSPTHQRHSSRTVRALSDSQIGRINANYFCKSFHLIFHRRSRRVKILNFREKYKLFFHYFYCSKNRPVFRV